MQLACWMCLAVVALASSPANTTNPSDMEMYVMEEVVCDLLRHHPVYRDLSLKDPDTCHYAISPFGRDLCVRVRPTEQHF